MSDKGLTDYALAKRSGVPQPTIFRILKGQSKDPKTDTIKALAKHLDVSVEELRGAAMEKNPTGRFHALTEEALELLSAFERLPPERQQAYRDFLFLEVFVLDHMPWLQRGRPSKGSYSDYERQMIELLKRLPSSPLVVGKPKK